MTIGRAGESDAIRSRVPAVVPVAAMATLATVVIAWFAYRAEKASRADAIAPGLLSHSA